MAFAPQGFIRVYFGDGTWSTIPLSLETTAKEVLKILTKKRFVEEPANGSRYSLYVRDATPNEEISERPLKDDEIPLRIQDTIRKYGSLSTFSFMFKTYTEPIEADIDEEYFQEDSEDVGEATVEHKSLDCIRCGYLYKMGKGNRLWRERWFELRDEELSYYKSRAHTKVSGVISIEDAVVRQSGYQSRRPTEGHMFEIQTKERVFQLKSRDYEDMQGWIAAMTKHSSENSLLDRLEMHIGETEFSKSRSDELVVTQLATLDGLLENKNATAYLRQFVTEQHRQESLLFWLDAEQFRISSASSVALMIEATRLYSTYLVPDAPLGISIESTNRNKIKQSLAMQKVTTEIFFEAQQEILNDLRIQIFPEFQKSKLYHQALANIPHPNVKLKNGEYTAIWMRNDSLGEGQQELEQKRGPPENIDFNHFLMGEDAPTSPKRRKPRRGKLVKTVREADKPVVRPQVQVNISQAPNYNSVDAGSILYTPRAGSLNEPLSPTIASVGSLNDAVSPIAVGCSSPNPIELLVPEETLGPVAMSYHDHEILRQRLGSHPDQRERSDANPSDVRNHANINNYSKSKSKQECTKLDAETKIDPEIKINRETKPNTNTDFESPKEAVANIAPKYLPRTQPVADRDLKSFKLSGTPTKPFPQSPTSVSPIRKNRISGEEYALLSRQLYASPSQIGFGVFVCACLSPQQCIQSKYAHAPHKPSPRIKRRKTAISEDFPSVITPMIHTESPTFSDPGPPNHERPTSQSSNSPSSPKSAVSAQSPQSSQSVSGQSVQSTLTPSSAQDHTDHGSAFSGSASASASASVCSHESRSSDYVSTSGRILPDHDNTIQNVTDSLSDSTSSDPHIEPPRTTSSSSSRRPFPAQPPGPGSVSRPTTYPGPGPGEITPPSHSELHSRDPDDLHSVNVRIVNNDFSPPVSPVTPKRSRNSNPVDAEKFRSSLQDSDSRNTSLSDTVSAIPETSEVLQRKRCDGVVQTNINDPEKPPQIHNRNRSRSRSLPQIPSEIPEDKSKTDPPIKRKRWFDFRQKDKS